MMPHQPCLAGLIGAFATGLCPEPSTCIERRCSIHAAGGAPKAPYFLASLAACLAASVAFIAASPAFAAASLEASAALAAASLVASEAFAVASFAASDAFAAASFVASA